MMQDEDLPFEWFERDDYPRILEVMSDTHRLPSAFDEWEKHALAGVQELQATRYNVIRTTIRSDAFADWCRERRLAPNAQGRLKYCKEQLRNMAAPAEVGRQAAMPATAEDSSAARPRMPAESLVDAPATVVPDRRADRLLGTGRAFFGAMLRLVSRRPTGKG